MTIRKLMTTGAVATMIGLGTLAATSTGAEARTVCNRFGDCWHESNRYDYPATVGVRYYGDNYNWRDRYHRHHWRDHHEGRGYWRNGLWITF